LAVVAQQTRRDDAVLPTAAGDRRKRFADVVAGRGAVKLHRMRGDEVMVILRGDGVDRFVEPRAAVPATGRPLAICLREESDRVVRLDAAGHDGRVRRENVVRPRLLAGSLAV